MLRVPRVAAAPPNILAKLPETGQRLAATGFQVEASTQAALTALIAKDLAQWREVVRTAQIVVN